MVGNNQRRKDEKRSQRWRKGKTKRKGWGRKYNFFGLWVSLGWDGEICPPRSAQPPPQRILTSGSNRQPPSSPVVLSAYGKWQWGTRLRQNLPVILKALTPSYAAMHKLLPSDWSRLCNPISQNREITRSVRFEAPH